MTKEKLEEFRKMLIDKKKEILEKLETISRETEEEPVIEYYDKATYQFSKEYKIRLEENEAKVLRDIEDALKKIDEGTYGICEECGEEIAEKRLKAVPWARLCIRCQEEQEEREEAEAGEEIEF